MTTILTKKKDSSGAPATADITSAVGGAELAVNTADKRLYTKNSSNNIVEVGTNPASLNLNADLTNTSGNLVVDPATQIFEIKGSGSTEGQIQLNCAVNSHGQIITAADHGVSATNTLTLPGGDTIGNANATLVSDTGTQTLTNKTLTSPTINGATIDTAVSISATGVLKAGGAITGASTVSDQDGDLRDIPVSQNLSGNYTLAIGDAGNQVTINTSNAIVTVPTGVFGVGDIISVISVNGCTATLACTAVNAVKAGDLAATASHTLDANGVASIMFSYTADLAVLTGNIS